MAVHGVHGNIVSRPSSLRRMQFQANTKRRAKECHGGFTIQAEQMDKVGRPDVDAFDAVMKREGDRQRGSFVSFGYTKDAEHECAAFHRRP